MKQKQTPKNQNAKALYDLILNYQIEGAQRGGIAQKVTRAQELLKNSHGPADEKEAFRLLEEVCYGKTSTKKDLSVRRYGYSFDDERLSMAAEPFDDLSLSRGLPQGLPQGIPSIFSRIGRSIPKPKQDVDYVDDVEEEVSDDTLYVIYTLAAALHRLGKGTGKDPNEAIRMLRIAEKCGSEQGARVEELAHKVMEEIIEEEDEETIADTTKSYVEVRDLYQENGMKKGNRYIIILHHADGGESVINFGGRPMLVYLLVLMTTKRQEAAPLSPRMINANHKTIVALVKKMMIRITTDENYWVDEFIYKEKEGNEYLRNSKGHEGQGCFSFCSDRYSNTITLINDRVKKAALNEQEMNAFLPQTTGGRDSVMFIGISPSQIHLPDSLLEDMNALKKRGEVPKDRPDHKWIPLL